MHVGYIAAFQNPESRLSDLEVYSEEVRLADLAEPLGFDSIWSVEHHFTDYTMCPDVLQFLTYMAGRTERVQLGSMVVVLPWHDPVRVAEQVALLDNLSGGRLLLGLGRGLGRIEFEGFRVQMSESRGRFGEYAELLLDGLERGYVEYNGEWISQPRRDLRPYPFRSFRGRTYAAAVSADSLPVAARLGVGLLVIPQKPWEQVVEDFQMYKEAWSEHHNAPPPKPLLASFVFVDPDADRARELGMHHLVRYYESVMKHYEMTRGHFANTAGYEYYSKINSYIDKHGPSRAAEDFANLMPWGTPAQVLGKFSNIRSMIDLGGMMCHFSFAGMDYSEAERNMRLFASEVLPELKRWDVGALPDPPLLSAMRPSVAERGLT